MSHICKRICRFKLKLSSYWQSINFFLRNCPRFHKHVLTKIVIFKYNNCYQIEQLRFPSKFYGRDWSLGMYFCCFWHLWTLKGTAEVIIRLFKINCEIVPHIGCDVNASYAQSLKANQRNIFIKKVRILGNFEVFFYKLMLKQTVFGKKVCKFGVKFYWK